MKLRRTLYPMLLLAAALVPVSCSTAPGKGEAAATSMREPARPPRLSADLEPEAYYYFMRGYMAKLENDPETALKNFSTVLQIDPDATSVKRETVEVLFSLDLVDQAVELAENILAITPDDTLILKTLGQAYTSKNHPEKAIPMFRHIVELEPDDTESRLHLSILYGSVRQYGKALRQIRGIIDTDREAALSALYYVGVIGMSEGDLEEAEDILLEAKKYGYEEDGLYLNLGAINDKRNNTSKAEKYYLKALELNPGSLAAMENLTQLYIKNGREEEALSLLDRMEEVKPGDIDVKKRRALLLMSLKDFTGAANVLGEVVSSNPDDTTFRYYLGLALEESGKYDQAIIEYRKLIAAEPGNVKPYLNLGYLYLQLDLYDEAEEIYTSLLGATEPMAEYYVYLGRVLMLKGNDKEAEKVLLRALKEFPDSDELHFNIAVLYEKQDRYDDMVSHLRRAIEINPQHADAMNFLGYSYAEKGRNLEEALRLINGSLALKPDNGYITDSLGWTYYMMGRYDIAIKTLKKAVKFVDNDPVIYEHLGDVYNASSNRDEAVKAWRRSLEVLDPDALGEPEATDLKKRVQDKIRRTGETLAD